MSDGASNVERRLLSIDRYPDPVMGYTTRAGEPTVLTTNRAFERTFGAVPLGSPVSAVVDRFGIATREDSDSLSEQLVSDVEQGIPVQADGDGYVAHVLPPGDDDNRYVLFMNRPQSRGKEHEGRTAGEDENPEMERATPVSGDTSRGEFGIDCIASALSHDLRNPLDVAKARLRAGRERGDDEHFEHVEAAHDRMERIINDVLTLSRGEDRVDPDAAVDLTTVAESAWETVETQAASLTIKNELPTTTADRGRTERLFENLFRNAVEHGEEPAITVGRIDTHGEGFYVADDGPGIRPNARSRVFDPGYSTQDNGTGLGLAIVQRIAAAHDWQVRAVDASDGGARIEVRTVRPAGGS